MDIWNETIKIRDKYKNRVSNKSNNEIAHRATLLLNQMNTAGGMQIMRNEVENFVNKFGSVKI